MGKRRANDAFGSSDKGSLEKDRLFSKVRWDVKREQRFEAKEMLRLIMESEDSEEVKQVQSHGI